PGREPDVVFAVRRELCCIGARRDATAATVEADPIDGDVVDHRAVVHVGDVGRVDVGDRAVVVELVAAPAAALIALAAIAEAVVDAAVEADVRAPVAAAPHIDAALPAPVSGRPQQAHGGRQRPGSGYPVVVLVSPRPVAGDPDVAGRRARRLNIDGEF